VRKRDCPAEEFNLEGGGQMMVSSEGAYLQVIGRRPEHRPYVWIGVDRGMYGTITNPRTLRRLAKAILRALDAGEGEK
jgi:hypothetical protein